MKQTFANKYRYLIIEIKFRQDILWPAAKLKVSNSGSVDKKFGSILFLICENMNFIFKISNDKKLLKIYLVMETLAQTKEIIVFYY